MRKIVALAVFLAVFISPLGVAADKHVDSEAYPSGSAFVLQPLYCPIEKHAYTITWQDLDGIGLHETLTIVFNQKCVDEHNAIVRGNLKRRKSF